MSASATVTERRLRQIYNALDANNNKKALQEADKLLKKQPNFQCAKALRALALYRLDRVQECQHIVESVVAQLPTDDNSLQALTICYKELHQAHKICELYEAVLNKEPANEEFLSHLFMAYVRVMDYKRQHQTAMSLYKAFPKNPYYFWAIMSLFMQAISTSSQSSMTAGVALQLADRMCQKFQKEERLESDAEVQLYLMVLEQKGNYTAALELLSGKLANLLRAPNFIKRKRIVYLKELKRWRELTEFCKQLIRESPTRWQNYGVFMSACFAAVRDEVGPAVDLRDGDRHDPLLQSYGSCSQRSPAGCPRLPSEGQSEGCGSAPDITQAIVDRAEDLKSAAASDVANESPPAAVSDVSKESPPAASIDVSKESPPAASIDVSNESPAAAVGDVSKESLPATASDVSKESPPAASIDVSKESPPATASDVSKESPPAAVSDVYKESPPAAVSDVYKESPPDAASDVYTDYPPDSASDVYKEYLPDAASDVYKESPTDAVNTAVFVAYREADTFLRRLRDDADRREKAPLLASLRLCILVNEHNQLHLLNHDIVKDLVEYVWCYGNKSCCFGDVRSVLPLVSSSRREELLQRCQAMVSLTSDSAPASLGDLVRHQTWLQLRQHYGTGLPGSERLTRVEQLCQWHAQTVRFGDGLLDTDFRPNDLYLVLAVYHLYDEWTYTGDSFHLIHALTLLDHASFVSPANFNFKLLAIHLYCILGATGAALTVCETLDLKSIQLDTLSHICCRSVAAQGYLASAQLLFNMVCKFFVSSSKDNSDSLIAAYKVGSFQQIPEFIGLRTRLYNSLNYRLTATDCCLLDLTVHTSHHSQTAEAVGYTDLLSACVDDGIMWNHLRDNRDMSVLPVFSDADAERRESARAISFKQDVALLKIRHQLLRAVLTAVSFPPSVDPAATFRQLSSELRQLSEGQQLQEAPRLISGGCDSRRLQLQLSVLPLLLLLIESTAAALDGAASAGDDAAQQLCAQLRLEHGRLEGGAAEQLESAALLAETLSVAAVLCGAAHAALRPADVRSRRKSQSADAHDHNAVVRALLALCDWLLQLLPTVDARLKLQLLSWRVRRLELPVCGLQQAVADGGARCQVLLGASYQDAVAELSKLLRHKRTYLSSCLL